MKLNFSIFTICILFSPFLTIAQCDFVAPLSFNKTSGNGSSKNGYLVNPNHTTRILNIFVNIIYDLTPDADPGKIVFLTGNQVHPIASIPILLIIFPNF